MNDSPMSAVDIDAHKKNAAAEKLRYTIGVVWPDGRVTEHVVLPARDGAIVGDQFGDVPVAWINGGPEITKRFKVRGCRLLSDVCEADGVPEKFAEWKQALSLRGRVKIMTPEKLYPPTVHRLRAASKQEVAIDQVFVPGEGLVTATDDAKAQRIASLLGSTTDDSGKPIVAPTAADRVKGKAS